MFHLFTIIKEVSIFQVFHLNIMSYLYLYSNILPRVMCGSLYFVWLVVSGINFTTINVPEDLKIIIMNEN